MKKLNRRDFVALSAAASASLLCQACSIKNKEGQTQKSGEKTATDKIVDINKGMSRDEIMMMLDQRVNNYMARSHHCAQTSFLALSEQFGLQDKEILKALTPLPGIAETGQTCGVIIGSLMAMGLVFGRDQIGDWQKYRDCLVPTGDFVDKFKKQIGSTQCADIVEKEFGKRLDLRNPKDHQEFVAADATSKCSSIVRKGVRIAAEIILNYTEKG